MLTHNILILIRSLPVWCRPVRLGRFIGLIYVKLGGSEWISFRTLGGVEYTLSLLCRTSAAQIWGAGDHDDEVTMFSKAVLANTTVIDVGANVGLITVPLSSICLNARFMAIEPSVANIEILEKNIRSNNIHDRVEIVRCALGSQVGTMTLIRESQFGSSTGNARLDTNSSNAEVTENVRIDTLDSVWKQHGKPSVSFVKIDVEGFEYPVLCGAKMMLSECRPIIYGEFHNVLMPKNGHNFLDVLQLFDSANYVVCQYISDLSLTIVHNPSPSTGNAFLVPIERIGDLPISNAS
jgi:FkbM family methyltransferase